MNQACAALLTCRETYKHYSYHFSGNVVHEDYADVHLGAEQLHCHEDYEHAHENNNHNHLHSDDHHDISQSSHGMKLNVTGGNVHYADLPHDIHPELAASAVNPSEAIIQVDGESYYVPLD